MLAAGNALMQLSLPSGTLDLKTTQVMGVLNVTPDSFSDGGAYSDAEAAVERALQMVAEGAALIDVGGESTRPGAAVVSSQEEIDRVVPVIELFSRQSAVPVSLDTSKPEVMRAGVQAGAQMLNDVRALTIPGALEAAADLQVPVCLMHMQGTPKNMQNSPIYQDVTHDIKSYLEERVAAATRAGIRRDQLIVDPGFGFGKTLQHNLQLLRNLDKFVDTDMPLLVGLSRKSMIGKLLENVAPAGASVDIGDRLAGSVTLALYAAQKGAHIVRVHDVRETVAALTIAAELFDMAREK
jgi:dihydropteroate synthase